MSGKSPAGLASGFAAEYAPLRLEEPRLGQVSLLPWDAEIFGFPVADYRPGAPEDLARGSFEKGLRRWAAENAVELVGCRVSAEATGSVALLEAAGFRVVELQTHATLPRLEQSRLAPCRLTIRAAEPADHARVSQIAGSAFAFGRYHADPFFPRELADRRFRSWIERAFANPSAGTWIGVVGPPGGAVGFVHVELDRHLADIRLLAADLENASLAGRELLLGALHALAARGAKRVTARLSPANTSALNIYASLGFQFHEPEVVLHWSPPGAPHLLSSPRGRIGKGEDGPAGAS